MSPKALTPVTELTVVNKPSVNSNQLVYDPETFEDFCHSFGFDSDSRKAYKTYKAVMKEWKNIELLFTPEQIEQLQEINYPPNANQETAPV